MIKSEGWVPVEEHLCGHEKHTQFMKNVCAIDDVEENDLLTQFDNLLNCIPNGGKLYKYRSLCGKSFAYAYDSLKNGYLWLPTAKILNDDYDSVLISDAVAANKCLTDYIMRDPEKTVYTLLLRCGEKYWNEDPLLKAIPFGVFLEIYDHATGTMDEQKLVNLLCAYPDGAEKLNHFRKLLGQLIENLRTALKDSTTVFFTANDFIQEQTHVFSMSESYDLGNMWGYYADSGRGFCIEYDYTKAKALGITAIRYLLNTHKVVYSDVPRQLPVELLAELNFFNSANTDTKNQLDHSTMELLLSKDICWEHEREWRIALGNVDCKLPVDIVNSIIIDERSLEKTNAKKLIRLCQKRGWSVKIRRNHPYDTSHSYEDFLGNTEKKH